MYQISSVVRLLSDIFSFYDLRLNLYNVSMVRILLQSGSKAILQTNRSILCTELPTLITAVELRLFTQCQPCSSQGLNNFLRFECLQKESNYAGVPYKYISSFAAFGQVWDVPQSLPQLRGRQIERARPLIHQHPVSTLHYKQCLVFSFF